MTRSSGARIIGAALSALCLVPLLGAQSPPVRPKGPRATPPSKAQALQPKVILITVDTLRADRLECYGYRKIKTPNINRLASEGIRFANAIAQVPLTLPSHCSILTGTFPIFHGVRDQAGFYLPEKRTTLAQVLKAQGFATAAFVSAFVLDSRFGLNRGFDRYDETMDSHGVSPTPQLERRGDRTLSQALAWMEKSGSAKFFVWLHFYDPHAPYTPPEPFRSRYAGRPYDGEVAFVDSLMGELVRFLERKGWYSETLLVFASDHGEDLGDHGENTHGFFVYDSTLRIPLIIKNPGGTFRGQVVGDPVQSVDIAPTILQVLSLPANQEMQGKGLLSLVLQKGWRPSPGLGETYYPFYHFGWSPLLFLRTGRFKYIEAPRPELYDLEKDPREARNLMEASGATALELKNQLFEALTRFSARDSPTAPARPVDEATLEKLKSLGYLGYAGRRAAEPADFRPLADPKEKLGVYNRLQSALLDEQNNRLLEALRKYRGLTESDPELIDGYIHSGLCYKRLGQYGDAIEQFRKALQRDPESTVATYNLAHAYALAGKVEEAAAGFRRTLELDPHESRAHVGLGIAFQLKGQLDQAVAEYERALEINPSDSLALSNLGAALLSQGNAEKAIASLQRALEIDPQNAEASNTLGSALLVKENLPEAIANFRKAVRLNPRYADAYTNLGQAQLKKGNFQEGISNLKKALEINPSSGYAHHLLAQAYRAQGMRQAAEAESQAAKKLGYH